MRINDLTRFKLIEFLRLTAVGLLTLVLSSAQMATASDGARSDELGLGIMLGEPSGISGRLNLSSKTALDFGLAFSANSDVLLLVDYLFKFPHSFHSSSQFLSQLTPYVGIGGALGAASQSSWFRSNFYTSSSRLILGVRIPLGLEWRPTVPSIGVFAEVAPGLTVLSSTQGFCEGDLGIRFYF